MKRTAKRLVSLALVLVLLAALSCGAMAASVYASGLAAKMRAAGISAETDLMKKSLKAQMKYADQTGARYVLMLGDTEMEAGRAQLKEMATSGQTELELGEIVGYIKERYGR